MKYHTFKTFRGITWNTVNNENPEIKPCCLFEFEIDNLAPIVNFLSDTSMRKRRVWTEFQVTGRSTLAAPVGLVAITADH